MGSAKAVLSISATIESALSRRSHFRRTHVWTVMGWLSGAAITSRNKSSCGGLALTRCQGLRMGTFMVRWWFQFQGFRYVNSYLLNTFREPVIELNGEFPVSVREIPFRVRRVVALSHISHLRDQLNQRKEK